MKRMVSPPAARLAGRIISIRMRGLEVDLPGCPTFLRTKQISHHVSDASETELRHISACAECAARVTGFQRRIGRTALAILNTLLCTLAAIGGGYIHERFLHELADTYAHFVFGLFHAPAAHSEDHERLVWDGTHSVARAIRHARMTLAPEHIGTIIDACSAGLLAASSSYAVRPHTLDAVWPMLEAVEEGITALDGSHRLYDRYTDLYFRLATESPVTIRHLYYCGIGELLHLGPHGRAVATRVLEKLQQSDHADEAAVIAAFVVQSDHGSVGRAYATPHILKYVAPHIASVDEEILGVSTAVSAALQLHVPQDRVQSLRHVLTRSFDSPSVREQIHTLHAVRAGVHLALTHLPLHEVSVAEAIQALSIALFEHDADRTKRPFFATVKIFEAVREFEPNAWSAALANLLRHLPSYKHYDVVSCAMSRDSATDDANSRDLFWNELTSLARADEEFAGHVRWVTARRGNSQITTLPIKPHHQRGTRRSGRELRHAASRAKHHRGMKEGG